MSVESLQVCTGIQIFVCLKLYVTEVDSGPAGADCLPYGVSHHRRGLCGNEGQTFHQSVRG